MATDLVTRRFTVDEYHRMAVAGILGEDDRVELLDGWIVEMSPIGSRHAGCVNRLAALLYRRLGDTVVLAVQNPVILNTWWEPQPDLAVLTPRPDALRRGPPARRRRVAHRGSGGLLGRPRPGDQAAGLRGRWRGRGVAGGPRGGPDRGIPLPDPARVSGRSRVDSRPDGRCPPRADGRDRGGRDSRGTGNVSHGSNPALSAGEAAHSVLVWGQHPIRLDRSP